MNIVGNFYLETELGFITGKKGYLEIDNYNINDILSFSTIDKALLFAKMHLKMCDGRCGNIDIVTFDKYLKQHWLCTVYC